MKTSQAATEFLVFVGFAVVILIGYLTVSHNFMNLTLINKDIKLAGDLASELKHEINLAGLSNHGYQKEYILPNKINNKDYEISVPSGSRELTIILEGNHYTEQLATEVYEAVPDINPGDIIYFLKNWDKVYISIFMVCNATENFETQICGTYTQCWGNRIPNNYGCKIRCEFVEEQNSYQWRIKEFCDGTYCVEGNCGAPIYYYECNPPLQCDYIYNNQACPNLEWTILGICKSINMPAVCCENPSGQSQGGGNN